MFPKMEGRNTLKHLDGFGWAAAVDAVVEERVTCPALVEPREDGSVGCSARWVREWHQGDVTYRPHRDHFRDDGGRVDNVGFERAMSAWSLERYRAVAVRVRFATDTQLADLARAFGSRFVVLKESRGGRTQYVRVQTFPAAKLYAVFAAIWGDAHGPNDWVWRFRAVKYLEGFTRAYCDENPAYTDAEIAAIKSAQKP